MAGNSRLGEQTISEQVLSLNSRMEEVAAAGEWLEVMDSIKKRDALLRDIDDSERHAALLAARCSTDQIRRLAEAAQRDLADELTALRRGKQAAASYQANALG